MNSSMDGEEIVDKLQEVLKQEIPHITYTTYLLPLKFDSFEGNHLTFKCNTPYEKETAETRYASLLLNALKYITNRDITFSIRCLEEEQAKNIEPEIISSSTDNDEEIDYSQQTLNPKYTFETFVVGSSNRFAHAAALAVGDNPAKTYNPLFIYGGSGLGKTHLMQAIGNKLLKNNRTMRIVYVTSETFTNQLIKSIMDGKGNNDPFRNKYRNADALLIDDIQFIAKKERVQEEFFHTFNTLYENGKQIIISSDKPPRDIPFLEDRLKSRFEWGLLADISCPDYETRVAILRKKALDEGIIIDDAIIANIATKIDSNVRELDGVFQKIVARASLTHIPITMELAENVINEFISKKERVISSDYIQDVVAKYFSIDKKDLSSEKRSNDIAFPRQIAMYLCRETANMSFPQIGIDFGNRDHSTVMHAYKKIEKEIKEKNNTKRIVDSVKNIIQNNE